MADVFIETLEYRRELASRVQKLFDLWGLSEADQMILLGLTPDNQSAFARFDTGECGPETRVMLVRVNLLLEITTVRLILHALM